MKFYPYEKGGGGENSFSHAEGGGGGGGGDRMFWGSFYEFLAILT